MDQPASKQHHRHALKINRRVVLQTARAITIRLWPLVLFVYLARVYVNVSDEQAFDLVQDVLMALWTPLFFVSFFYVALVLVLMLGTKIRMKQAQLNPGPGKPPRDRPTPPKPS